MDYGKSRPGRTLKLSEILETNAGIKFAKGSMARHDRRIDVNGLQHDSRKVSPGNLFIALVGESFNGHRFLAQAVEAGASALLVQSDHLPEVLEFLRGSLPESGTGEGQPGPPILVAENTRAAMAQIATSFYGHPSRELSLVGITGTNGKTSLTYLLEGVIATAGGIPGIIGTVEARYLDRVFPKSPNTTPESLELQATLRTMADAGVSHVAMEVSSHALLTHRVDGSHFVARVFTNLSRDHMDFHGDMESYYAAKARLFTVFEGGPAIINVENAWGRRLHEELLAQGRSGTLLVGYSTSPAPQATVYVDEALVNEDGIDAIIQTPAGKVLVSSPLMGHLNLENITAAAAIGTVMGFSCDAVGEGISSVGRIPGRLERVPDSGGGRWPLVLIDYAHTPQALEKALSSLRDTCQGNLTVVFGCGGDRDKGKRPQMGAIAARIADRLVITSDNPRNEQPLEIMDAIAAGSREHGKTPEMVVCRRAAIQQAIALAAPEDVVLVAGKGHETTQRSGDGEVILCDMDEAQRALAVRVVGEAMSTISATLTGIRNRGEA